MDSALQERLDVYSIRPEGLTQRGRHVGEPQRRYPTDASHSTVKLYHSIAVVTFRSTTHRDQPWGFSKTGWLLLFWNASSMDPHIAYYQHVLGRGLVTGRIKRLNATNKRSRHNQRFSTSADAYAT